MNYIIIEAQTTDGTTAVLTYIENGTNAALAKYFDKCAAAARSSVPLHAVSLITDNGNPVPNRHEAFDHTPAPAAEE